MATKQRILCLAPGRATPGITLARAITDREGSILLSAGTVLDLAMLERLIRRGVDAISVLVPDNRDEATIADELRAVQRRIEIIFRGPGNPARDQLHAAVLNYRIESTK
ncbi:MAG: hypothetical protein QMB52_05570 [Propionivibrio sp.]